MRIEVGSIGFDWASILGEHVGKRSKNPSDFWLALVLSRGKWKIRIRLRDLRGVICYHR